MTDLELLKFVWTRKVVGRSSEQILRLKVEIRCRFSTLVRALVPPAASVQQAVSRLKRWRRRRLAGGSR